jgi:phosphatidylglycerophosphate synthase
VLTEGERWTEDQLTQLRNAQFRPGAQVAFLRAAQARSNATRRARPGLARQELTWILAGTAAWLGLGRLGPDRVFGRVQRRGLLWWAACAVMLDWHLGMLETPTGSPVGLGAADALTLARAWLVPAVAEAAEPRLVLLGALTDLADGRVARATRCTRFGRDLEGLADAAFALAALHGAVSAGHLSPPVAALERARLAAGTAYAGGAYFASARAPDARITRSGRSTAPIRMAGLITAGLGRRRLADRLLLTGTVAAVAGQVRRHLSATEATEATEATGTTGEMRTSGTTGTTGTTARTGTTG